MKRIFDEIQELSDPPILMMWKVVILVVFFAYKKYSHNFIKLRFNRWCHINYFKMSLLFLDQGTFQFHCSPWRVRKLSDLIKNTLICVPKMNKGLTGLEWQGK